MCKHGADCCICCISDDLWWEGAGNNALFGSLECFVTSFSWSCNRFWSHWSINGSGNRMFPFRTSMCWVGINSHTSSELTDSAIDESETQSPTSRTRGSLAAFSLTGSTGANTFSFAGATRSKAKNSSKSDQNLGTSTSIQSPNAIYLAGECLEFPFLTYVY